MFDRKEYYEKTREKQLTTAKEWRRDNRERLREKSKADYRKTRARSPIDVLLWGAKGRAKKKGIEFNVTPEDIQHTPVCPIFGIELEYNAKGKRQDNSASLDRIDPAKGYVVGNVIVVSWRANRIKCDATLEELEQLVSFYRDKAKVTFRY